MVAGAAFGACGEQVSWAARGGAWVERELGRGGGVEAWWGATWGVAVGWGVGSGGERAMGAGGSRGLAGEAGGGSVGGWTKPAVPGWVERQCRTAFGGSAARSWPAVPGTETLHEQVRELLVDLGARGVRAWSLRGSTASGSLPGGWWLAVRARRRLLVKARAWMVAGAAFGACGEQVSWAARGGAWVERELGRGGGVEAWWGALWGVAVGWGVGSGGERAMGAGGLRGLAGEAGGGSVGCCRARGGCC
nr:glycine-rich cell wall structural protein-like [Lolium perenne]